MKLIDSSATHARPVIREKSCEILVVGAGLSGIGTAIKLKEAGFDDFIIVERAGSLGGTWRDNSYPGVTVDIPTIYYSFSFEQSAEWTTFYAPQSELLGYCHRLADKYQVEDHVVYDTLVEQSRYDGTRNEWVTQTASGVVYRSRFLITATGLFAVPRLPDIPGLKSFAGKTMHSKAWDHGYDFGGKQVAVIGTGATGVQIIPELAEVAGKLYVFQRTPTWVFPKPDKPIGPKMRWAMRHIPGFQPLLRLLSFAAIDMPLFGILGNFQRYGWLARRMRGLCIRHIARSVSDPALRAKLTPTFDFGCRRPTFSNKFYSAFERPNVELVTDRIQQVDEHAVVTVDGTERPIDVLVCATGFHVFEKDTNPAFPVYGTAGESLSEVWARGGHEAFKGSAVPGFPNFFLIYGPYSVSSLSFIRMIENAVLHILRVLKEARRLGASRVEVTSEAMEQDMSWVYARNSRRIWESGNCVGAGPPRANLKANPSIRSTNSFAAWKDQRFFPLSHYRFDRAPVVAFAADESRAVAE
ncbi:MAG: NAD(P)/FAD-dependent oxidoreductase [Sphingobium sp.]